MEATYEVAPIIRGADSIIGLNCDAALTPLFNFPAGRFVVDFKYALTDAAVLATIDSASSPTKVLRTSIPGGAYHIDLLLTKEQTILFLRDTVMFDILVIDGSSRQWLPGIWTWPVQQTVTVWR